MNGPFGLAFAAWNAWVLAWWVVRFHPRPRALVEAIPANLPWHGFSFWTLAANWGEFAAGAVVAAAAVSLMLRIGRILARWCGWRDDGTGAPVALGVGTGATAVLALGAGFAGLLFMPPRPAALAACAVVVLADGPRLVRGVVAFLALLRAEAWDRLSAPLRAVAAVAGVVTLLGLANIELGWDALTYHLRLASFYGYRHKVWHVWHHYCAWLPQGFQVLYAPVLMAGGESAVRFLNAVFGMALLVAARALARRAGAPAWPAVLLCAASPTFLNLVSRAYVDFGFSLMFAVSLHALLAGRRGLAVSGACAGFAMAGKYQGILMPLAALAAASRGPVRWKSAIAWCSAAFLPVAPWLWRNWTDWGNPVHPFLGRVFGTSVALPPGFVTGFEGADPAAAFAATLPARAEALFANFGSINGPLVPLVAGLLPLVILRGPSGPGAVVRRALLGFLAGWFLLCPDARYFLPALPWLGVAVAGAFAAIIQGRVWRRAFVEAALAAGFLYSAGIQWEFYSPVSMASGCESRRAKLRRTLAPPPYSAYAAEALNARVPAGDRVLWLCHFNTYYASRECVADFHFGEAHLTRLIREAADAEGIARRLRQLGVRWLLSTGTGAVQYADLPGFFAVTDRGWQEWARLVAERTVCDWRTHEYTLYRMTAPHPAVPVPALPVHEALAFRAADAAMAAGRPAEALASYASPPALLQGVGSTAAREAGALAFLGRDREAVAAYRRALAAGCDTPPVRGGLALVLLRQGKPDEALREAEAAWAADPLSAQVAATMAGILATAGRLAEAKDWAGRALRLAPRNAEIRSFAARVAAL